MPLGREQERPSAQGNRRKRGPDQKATTGRKNDNGDCQTVGALKANVPLRLGHYLDSSKWQLNPKLSALRKPSQVWSGFPFFLMAAPFLTRFRKTVGQYPGQCVAARLVRDRSDQSCPRGGSRPLRARAPTGRWAKPQDIAGTAIWLASPASDYVTGVAIEVDGGYASSL
jgi:hypothetical protein